MRAVILLATTNTVSAAGTPVAPVTLQFAVMMMLESMAKSNQLGVARARRLGRYLVGTMSLALQFPFQELPDEIVVTTDADWASSLGNQRKSEDGEPESRGHCPGNPRTS